MKQIKGLVMGLSAVLLLGACGTTETGTEENGAEEIDELVLGYFPSADVENMAASARPLEEYLSEQLDIEVTGQVMTDYTGLIEAMRNQNADVAFLPPFAYVQAEERANVEVLLKAIRDGSESYVAQYNVAADSEFDSIDDLVEAEGLVWAFTDYTSTSGYLFPAQQLMDLGIEDLDSQFTLIDVGAHDSALLSVLDGQADFATTFEDARVRLEDEIPDIYDQIRVIGTTEEIPNATLSVRSELPEELKERIAEAFLNMNDDPEMLEVLEDVYNWEGFAPAQSSDYDVVRDVYSQFEELIEE